MPIKGLTERRRLLRLGKIHLGVKATNAKGVEYPKAVDYFVCPPEVQAVFGEKPAELRILIPVEDEEKWASQYYRLYSQTRGLICKGDGEVCIRTVDTATGGLPDKDSKQVAMHEMTCDGRDCPEYGVRCKEVMNLQFLLPEVPGLGIWQIDTGSVNSIQNINSAGDLVRRLYGRISMIPLLLTLEPQTVKSPDDGKQKTVWVLNLRVKQTLSEMMQLTLKPATEMVALTSGNGDDILMDEPVDLPVSDDERPELILPEDQAPKGEKPKPTKKAPVADVIEADPPAPTEPTEPRVGRTRESITNLADAFKACFEDFGLQPKQVIGDMGYKSQMDVSELPFDVYLAIKALHEG